NREAAPAEVRRAISGATETLSAVIKPLIRKPGEGAWSDADQAKLSAIVGNLLQVNDMAQFHRELENVRLRINSNFGINLPPISRGAGASKAPSGNYTWSPDGGLTPAEW